MKRPEKPTGTTGAVVSWMEYPCPVAEKCAVMPPTVKSMGKGVWSGALSKSNKTLCASAGTSRRLARTMKICVFTMVLPGAGWLWMHQPEETQSIGRRDGGLIMRADDDVDGVGFGCPIGRAQIRILLQDIIAKISQPGKDQRVGWRCQGGYMRAEIGHQRLVHDVGETVAGRGACHDTVFRPVQKAIP